MARRRKTKFRRRVHFYMRMGIIILILIMVVLVGMKFLQTGPLADRYVEWTGSGIDANMPEIDVELLSFNEYSRPGTRIGKIKGIVVHYTANPGSTAMQNRNYFEGLKRSHETKVSSHFIVGLEGEIIQCVPTWEVAYASNERNSDTISIETCHLTADGTYTEETYQSMVELTAWLCQKFKLTEEDVIRHYDITGKNCPKYFVENEGAWDKFKLDIKNTLDNM